VALSRIYLGVHFLSDTLAAVAGSAAWLAVCITSISSLRRRRAARKEE
jgi:membrane-associated phospholipid phosphatase